MCYNSIIGTDFNPRSREGSDIDLYKQEFKVMDFNPRSREGSDFGITAWKICRSSDFNPRSREGSDYEGHSRFW